VRACKKEEKRKEKKKDKKEYSLGVSFWLNLNGEQ
jgi:hypothetical protein